MNLRLFSDYLENNEFYCLWIFLWSYKSFEEVLNSDLRVDKLQTFSPAFFKRYDEKFKKNATMFLKKDANLIVRIF